jgi:hypothetical protein
MGISPVNGTTANGSSTTVTLNYSPQPGNAIFLFIYVQSPLGSLTAVDNLGNPMVLLSSTANPQGFCVPSVPAGVTGYTLTWTPTRSYAIVLQEYSGATDNIVQPVPKQNNGTGTVASLAQTLQDANDFFVCGIGSTQNLTTPVIGNIRQTANGTPGATSAMLVDNTQSSIGSLTCSATVAVSAGWFTLGVQLKVNAPLFVAPSIGAEYSWGGGDGW